MLELEHGVNVYDLGGIQTPSGPTLAHRFLRSGTTHCLDDGELEQLYRYGVRCVVDLRGDQEVAGWPDRLRGYRDVRYYHVPVFDKNIRAAQRDYGSDTVGFYTANYMRMIDNHRAVRRVFSAFARQRRQDCILFHCTAGLDRTGMVSMLLLGLAGASRRDVVADYVRALASPEKVERILDAALGGGGGFGELVDDEELAGMKLLVQVAARVYDVLLGRYGSIEGYLRECGLNRFQIARVRRHLLR